MARVKSSICKWSEIRQRSILPTYGTYLRVRERHSVFIHASSHDMQKLLVLNQTVAIKIVYFEEKFNFVFGALTGELVHGVDKLLKGNCPGIVFVKNLENSLVEEWLKVERVDENMVERGFWGNGVWCWEWDWLTFFEMTIFLKSSRLISFPSPTVFLKSCSSLSSDVLSNPVLVRVFVKFEMHSMTWVVDTALVPSVSKWDFKIRKIIAVSGMFLNYAAFLGDFQLPLNKYTQFIWSEQEISRWPIQLGLAWVCECEVIWERSLL